MKNLQNENYFYRFIENENFQCPSFIIFSRVNFLEYS